MKTNFLDFLNEGINFNDIVKNNILNVDSITGIDLTEAFANTSTKYVKMINIRNCIDCNLENINFSKFKELTSIEINMCSMASVSDLSGCTQLKRLVLYKNNLIVPPDLSNNPNLDFLNISYNENLKELPDLSKCVKLRKLFCSDCSIEDISTISNCVNLIDISLYNNKISGVVDISNLNKLSNANLSDNPITEIKDIHINPKIESATLSFCNNKIEKMPNIIVGGLTTQLTIACFTNNLLRLYDIFKFLYDNKKISINVKFKNRKDKPTLEESFALQYINYDGEIIDKDILTVHFDYYLKLFYFAVYRKLSFEEFMEIEWPDDLYNIYNSKVTSNIQKKYIGYLEHKKDFGSSNDYLFNYD